MSAVGGKADIGFMFAMPPNDRDHRPAAFWLLPRFGHLLGLGDGQRAIAALMLA